MAQLALESVTKRYGDLVAMNDFTLTVRDHEFLVLLGPSGAGKTTTLRTVAGLEKPDHGQVRIGETVVTRMSPAERNVAFVFQFYALYPFMTARENMAFPLKANPMPKQEIERRVGEVAKTLQIGHLLARKPGQLSGGEQQRVALGRAMVRRPQAFLMDEPLTNLDAKLRTTMRAELKHLQRDLGATTLYVTHDQVEALTMGDRVAVLKSGMLQQVGTPREIYDRPTNTFVAAFVGHPLIALLPCMVQDGALALEGSGARIPLTGALAQVAARATDRRVTLGLRSEDVRMHTEEQPDAIRADVYAVEPLGDRTIYDLQIQTAPSVHAPGPEAALIGGGSGVPLGSKGGVLLRARTDPDYPLLQGERVWVTFNHERAHLFDAGSGERIG